MITHFSNVSAAEWWRFATLKSWHWNKTEGMALTGQRRSSAENELSLQRWKCSAFPQKANGGWRCIQPVPAIWGDAGFSLQFNAAVIWAFRLRKAFILNAGLTIVVERLAAPNRTRVIWSVRVKLFGFASRRECQRTEATAWMTLFWGCLEWFMENK